MISTYVSVVSLGTQHINEQQKYPYYYVYVLGTKISDIIIRYM